MFVKRITFCNETIRNFDKIIDVRSESEFDEDSIPTSENIPVLNNFQRKRVGKIYKKDKFEARKIGATIIVKNIENFLKKNTLSKSDNILIYCWRGGMRSLSLYLILKNIGYKVSILNKGYKEYRSFINNFFINELDSIKFKILNGLTGTGKTFFLNKLSTSFPVIDFEKLANHKGSILGDIPGTQQPSQKQFESRIWYNIFVHQIKNQFWAESESHRIGKLFIPNKLFEKMKKGKVFNLIIPKKTRVEFILKDYKYLIDDKKKLNESLVVLKKFIGDKEYKNLKNQIENKKYDKFVFNLLTLHYDKVYKKICNYDKTYKDIKLSSIDDSGFEILLKKI